MTSEYLNYTTKGKLFECIMQIQNKTNIVQLSIKELIHFFLNRKILMPNPTYHCPVNVHAAIKSVLVEF